MIHILMTTDDPKGIQPSVTIWDITFDDDVDFICPIPDDVLQKMSAPGANPVISLNKQI